jgi:hypothetical protein
MMNATKILPERYAFQREINLQKDQALLIKLNLWGLALLPVIGYILLRFGVALHPDFHSIIEVITPQIPIFTQILGLILGLIVTTVLHELVHGAFFWTITRQVPKFGFRGAYAFAAAPEWYIPRLAYFSIGAAPLVIISIIGIFCIPIISSQFLFIWLFCLLANASGAIGDVYILAFLIHQPATAMIQDRGDVISVYTEATH